MIKFYSAGNSGNELGFYPLAECGLITDGVGLDFGDGAVVVSYNTLIEMLRLADTARGPEPIDDKLGAKPLDISGD